MSPGEERRLGPCRRTADFPPAVSRTADLPRKYKERARVRRLGNRPSERQKPMTLETGQEVRVGYTARTAQSAERTKIAGMNRQHQREFVRGGCGRHSFRGVPSPGGEPTISRSEGGRGWARVTGYYNHHFDGQRKESPDRRSLRRSHKLSPRPHIPDPGTAKSGGFMRAANVGTSDPAVLRHIRGGTRQAEWLNGPAGVSSGDFRCWILSRRNV